MFFTIIMLSYIQKCGYLKVPQADEFSPTFSLLIMPKLWFGQVPSEKFREEHSHYKQIFNLRI